MRGAGPVRGRRRGPPKRLTRLGYRGRGRTSRNRRARPRSRSRAAACARPDPAVPRPGAAPARPGSRVLRRGSGSARRAHDPADAGRTRRRPGGDPGGDSPAGRRPAGRRRGRASPAGQPHDSRPLGADRRGRRGLPLAAGRRRPGRARGHRPGRGARTPTANRSSSSSKGLRPGSLNTRSTISTASSSSTARRPRAAARRLPCFGRQPRFENRRRGDGAARSGRARTTERNARVAFLITRPDRPRGRGRHVGAPPAKEVAERLGIEVRQPEKLDESTDVAGVEAVVVAAYGALIPEALLDRTLWLNVHPSLLPRWRGAAPVERSIMAGDTEGRRHDPPHDGGARRGPDCGPEGFSDSGGRGRRVGLREGGSRLPQSSSRECWPHPSSAAARGGSDVRRAADRRRPRARLGSTGRSPPQPDSSALAPHRCPRRRRRPDAHRVAGGPGRCRVEADRRRAGATRGAARGEAPHDRRGIPSRPARLRRSRDGLERVGAECRDRAVALRGGLLAARRADRDSAAGRRADLPLRRR